MGYLILFFLIINLYVVLKGIVFSLKRESNLVIWWLFSLYFGILFLVKYFSFKGIELGYSGDYVNISDRDKIIYYQFAFFSNLMFFLGQFFFLRQRTKSMSIILYKINYFPFKIYFLIFLISFIFLFYRLRNQSYTEIVEYRGGSWDLVFFQVSIPLLIYLFITKKKKFLLIIIVISSLVLTFLTSVRSFSLMTVFSLLFCFVDMKIARMNKKSLKKLFDKKFIPYILLIGLLFIIGSFFRGVKIEFPENRLIDIGMVSQSRNENGDFLGWASYYNYLVGFLKPISFGFIDYSNLPESVAEYNAKLYYDFSDFSLVDNYYHMPALWFNELYMSFGNLGFLFAFFYGLYMSYLEKLLKSNSFNYIFFLPIYVTNFYYIYRGAIDNASSSIAYCFIITLIFVQILKINNRNENTLRYK